MFDMRLGLALKRSVGEIHSLPYPEYRRWRVMYALEPWGWTETETQVARILAMLRNVNATKTKDLKTPADFMRDMAKAVLGQLAEEATPEVDPSELPFAERQAWLIEKVKKDMNIK